MIVLDVITATGLGPITAPCRQPICTNVGERRGFYSVEDDNDISLHSTAINVFTTTTENRYAL